MKRDDAWLQKLYTKYNKLYFDDKLPPVNEIFVHWSPLPEKDDAQIDCRSIKHEDISIEINSGLKKYPRTAKLSLLHEQCHLACLDEKAIHGKRWKAEMRRIAALKAMDNLW